MAHAISTLVISARDQQNTHTQPSPAPIALETHAMAEVGRLTRPGSLAKHADMSIKALKWTGHRAQTGHSTNTHTHTHTLSEGRLSILPARGDENCQLYAFPLMPPTFVAISTTWFLPLFIFFLVRHDVH